MFIYRFNNLLITKVKTPIVVPIIILIRISSIGRKTELDAPTKEANVQWILSER